MFFRTCLFSIGWVFLLFVSSILQSFALETPFTTEITTNYTIDKDAITTVEQNIVLTNTSSNSYAQKYAIEVGSASLTNITSEIINGDPLEFTTDTTDTSTIITLVFGEKVVGRDQSLKFKISYTQPDIAQLSGSALEVSIPKVDVSEDVNQYLTNIYVDNSFGDPVVLSPESEYKEVRNGFIVYTYTNPDTHSQGITALFGESQVMQFTLNYHLENPTVNSGITQITIPPDTPYQKVYYSNIDPKPDSISPDGDGNWLATYRLKPKVKQDVIVQGFVELYISPTVDVPDYTKNLKMYLSSSEHWPVDNQEIKQLAEKLKTPKSIYLYLVENFSYNYSKLDNSDSRLGGLKAIQEPDNVICQEFTDAFITLARAAGIPAREHNGFAYTQNSNLRPLSLVKDVLHSWPEYYDIDREQWIPVDPTWGNTTGGANYFDTMDLNHFTFIIRGLDSNTPVAPGYYKFPESTERDVLVDFSTETPTSTAQINVSVDPSFLSLAGVATPYKVNFNNTGNTAIYLTNSAVTSSNLILSQTEILDVSVLPYGSETTNVWGRLPTPLSLDTMNLVVTSDEQRYETTFRINSKKQVYFVSSLLGVGLGSTFIAYFSWRLLVPKRK